MKFKNNKIKWLVVISLVVLIAACFSCGNPNAEEETVESQNETIVAEESEEAFVAESIDLSDVNVDVYRITLAKIDELNHTIGKPIYVTKEDYLNYKDVNVSLIGDSIAELSKTYLHRCFRHIVQDSVPGREMIVGIEAFDAIKKIDRIGDIMILSLGNNAMKGIEVDVLEYIYNGIEGRPLIIPTIVMPYAGQERNRNRDLIEFASTHENCYIADWNKVARMGENFITEDGVHPTGDGSAAYAQLMLKTVIDVMKK